MAKHSSQPKLPAQASIDIDKSGKFQANEPVSEVVGLNSADASDRSDQDVLVHLFSQHYTSLVRLASFLLDDVASCEEIVQDAFVKMQVTRSRPEKGKEAAYLRSIVLNGARSKMRRRMVKRRVMSLERPGYTPPVESEIIDEVERQNILAKLKKLPRRQAEVLTLRFYMDLSEEEIAQTLNISKGSVKTHASRGLEKMAEFLAGTEND